MLAGASPPHKRPRVSWLSSVSPSTILAWTVKSSARRRCRKPEPSTPRSTRSSHSFDAISCRPRCSFGIPGLAIVRRRDAGPQQPNQMPTLDRNVALVRPRPASHAPLHFPDRHFRPPPHDRQRAHIAGVTARARDFKVAKASVLPPLADLFRVSRHVSKVPMRRYSMTSSARAINVGGISAPSVFPETSQQDLSLRL